MILKRYSKYLILSVVFVLVMVTSVSNVFAEIKISNLMVPEYGSTINGVVQISGNVEDTIYGIKTIEVYMDGNLIASGGYKSSTKEFLTRFHTRNFEAGQHQLTVTAVSNNGNQRSLYFGVVFIN